MLSALNSCLMRVVRNEVTRTACCQSSCARHYSTRNAGEDETKYISPLKDLLDNSATFEDLHTKSPNGQWATHPYPAILKKHLEEETGVDPTESTIILFPGQGTQFIGMGRDLLKFPLASDLFSIASEVVGIDLTSIVTQEDLNRYSQELIVVSSLAALEKLREERPSVIPSCVATAGFSLGEITALIFAGAIPLEQGLRLVSIRSAAMEAASKETPGGMLSVMYAPECNIKQVCTKAVENCALPEGGRKPFCKVANYLFPQAKVLSGNEEALRYIESNARELGIRRTKRLKVAGAFHSEAVFSAVMPVRQALSLCDVTNPQIRVMSGVDGKHYRDAKHIQSQLPRQIISSVRWEQLIHNMYTRPLGHHFPRTFEVGPGNTLRAILRQVNAKAWDNSFSVSV